MRYRRLTNEGNESHEKNYVAGIVFFAAHCMQYSDGFGPVCFYAVLVSILSADPLPRWRSSSDYSQFAGSIPIECPVLFTAELSF